MIRAGNLLLDNFEVLILIALSRYPRWTLNLRINKKLDISISSLQIFLPWSKLLSTSYWVRLSCGTSNKDQINLQINKRSRSTIDLDIHNKRISCIIKLTSQFHSIWINAESSSKFNKYLGMRDTSVSYRCQILWD